MVYLTARYRYILFGLGMYVYEDPNEEFDWFKVPHILPLAYDFGGRGSNPGKIPGSLLQWAQQAVCRYTV